MSTAGQFTVTFRSKGAMPPQTFRRNQVTLKDNLTLPMTSFILKEMKLCTLCNRPRETRPSKFSPFIQWKFRLPVTWWNFQFYLVSLWLQTHRAYIICARLKKARHRPDRKGQPGGKFIDPVTFFPKTLWEYRRHWICYSRVQLSSKPIQSNIIYPRLIHSILWFVLLQRK